MDLGLMLPIVTLPPKFQEPEWQRNGTAADLIAVAQAAEAAGYRYLGSPEHVALPEAREDTRGGTYWCPFSTLGVLAGATTSISLLTYVLVLGYHHPLEVAKRVGTLDRLSSGRAILGVGTGSLEEEFDLLGAPFADRGARADDALAAIHAARGARVPSYAGKYVAFDGMIVDPGLRPDQEIWVGGRSWPSLRRAITYGDVWSPFALDAAQVIALLNEPRAQEAMAKRTTGLRVVTYPSVKQIDPIAAPEPVAEDLAQMSAAGIDGFIPHFVNRSRSHFIEQMQALAELNERL